MSNGCKLSKQDTQARLVQHVRTFTKCLSSDQSRENLRTLYEKNEQRTFGHAMHEYCYFKWQLSMVLERRLLLYKIFKASDVFMELYGLLNDVDNMPYSFKFYHGSSAQKKRDAYIKSLEDLLLTQVQSKQEDFNNFILTYKNTTKLSKQALMKNKLLSEHMITLKKFNIMQKRICDLIISNTDNDRAVQKLQTAIKEAQKQQKDQKKFLNRTVKKTVKLLKTEQLSSFWLTFRLRLIVSRTDNCIKEMIRNSQVIYDESQYCERLKLLQSLDLVRDQMASYSKEKLKFRQQESAKRSARSRQQQQDQEKAIELKLKKLELEKSRLRGQNENLTLAEWKSMEYCFIVEGKQKGKKSVRWSIQQ